MHKLATLAAVGALAVTIANCSNAHEGANSANSMFPLTSVVGPSSVNQARASGNDNGKGGNKGNNPAATSDPSLELMMVNDVRTEGYSWGDTITFIVSTSESNPNVELLCSQNSEY